MQPRVLGVFCKEPRPGQVKTRLAAARGADWAARAARAFLEDTLERLRPLEGDRVIVFDPPEAQPFFEPLAAGGWRLVPQGPGDLGTRMSRFLAGQFARGVGPVVLIGADSPTLPFDYVDQAFRMLEASDLVLGPACDGGYYLIGAAQRPPAVFEGIDWGTERVLEQTARRAQALNLKLSLLPPWYDLDTPEDWQLLAGHVALMRGAGLDPEIPRTEVLLRFGD